MPAIFCINEILAKIENKIVIKILIFVTLKFIGI